MRDRALQETITVEAARRTRPAAEIARQAERNVKEVAARMSPLFFEFIRPLVVWICTRLYQGIHLDEEGIAEVRQAANRGGLILCPSHKSHMDYVILTLLFYEKGLLPPHVAAGINLAFWPFGAIARWCGGFFIRRSFKGDHLYSAVVRAYVKRLMRDGFPQEFFIEGGRSRTGKLAFPKTGLLAWRSTPGARARARTCSSCRSRSTTRSSRGRQLRARARRRREEEGERLVAAGGAQDPAHAPRAHLRAVRLAISLAELTGGATSRWWSAIARATRGRRAFVQSLANRIAYGINRASTITPVGLCAAALLSGNAPITGADLAVGLGLLRRIAVQGGGTCPRRSPARARSSGGRPDWRGPGDAPARRRGRGARAPARARPTGVPRRPARRARLLPQQCHPPLRRHGDHRRAARGAAHPRIRRPRARWKPTRAGSRACSSSSSCTGSARASRRSSRRRGRRWPSWVDGAPGAGPTPRRIVPVQMVVPYADAYRVAALTLTTWPGGDRRVVAQRPAAGGRGGCRRPHSCLSRPRRPRWRTRRLADRRGRLRVAGAARTRPTAGAACASAPPGASLARRRWYGIDLFVRCHLAHLRDPGPIRTGDLRFRKPLLYPPELRGLRGQI